MRGSITWHVIIWAARHENYNETFSIELLWFSLKMSNNQTKMLTKKKRNAANVTEKITTVKNVVVPYNSNKMLNSKKTVKTIVDEGNKSNRKYIVNNTAKAIKGMQFQSQAVEQMVKSVIESFALPREMCPVRLGSQYGSKGTATAHPFSRETPYFGNFSAGGTANTDTCLWSFRDPYCAYIIPQACGTGLNGIYSYMATFPVDGNFFPSRVPYLTYGSGNQVHGPTMYPGRLPDQKRNYFFAMAGDSFYFQVTVGSPALVFRPFFWLDDYELPEGTINVSTGTSGGNATFTAPITGYYSFDVCAAAGYSGSPSAVNCNYQIKLTTGVVTGYTFGHKALPDIDAHVSSIDEVKLYGVGQQMTPNASPNNRQGKLTSVQAPAGSSWYQLNNFAIVSTIEGAIASDVTEGLYGFLKPTQPSDLDFRTFDDFNVNNTGSNFLGVDAWFPLRKTSDFLVTAVSITDVLGQDLFFTCSYAFEFKTKNRWYDIEGPIVPSDIVNTAMGILSKLPQFYGNPVHLREIWDWIKNAAQDVGSFLVKAAPYVVAGAKVLSMAT